MTAIQSNSRFSAWYTKRELHEYQVEVITFDGDSEIFYIEAYSASEAQSIAASQVANADYTMVQGVA